MYRYQLQPYKGANSRHKCPACGKPRQFTLYIDTQTGETLAPYVGKCNRLDKCGHHYTPKQYFADSGSTPHTTPVYHLPKTTQKQPTYMHPAAVESSFKHFNNNHFVSYLNTLFGAEITNTLLKTYPIGTSKHWQGATIFWQVDARGNVRTGKIMLYNSATGKRVKQPYSHITWAHKLLQQSDYSLKQCLFGEHLLSKEPNKTICLVESEKTAIIASVYMPQYLWLAVGNLADLSPAKCQAIINRKVILFPDLKAYDKWQAKAAQISPRWQVSNFIETHATDAEKAQGLDIADYLLKFNYKGVAPAENTTPTPVIVTTNNPSLDSEPVAPPLPQTNWDNDIKQLETFFVTQQIPNCTILLSPGETITNPAKFIHSHFEMIKGNNGNPAFLPYLNRLYKLKSIIG